MNSSFLQSSLLKVPLGLSLLLLLASLLLPSLRVSADETCMSPYMAKITGHEEYVYVWTLGVEGWGDGSDKLVTIDVRPDSKTRGAVIHSVSLGGRLTYRAGRSQNASDAAARVFAF